MQKGNDSDPFHLGNTYGGLPTNLVIKNTWDKIGNPPSFSSQITNGIGWVLLMLAFIFLRKSAWKFLKREGLVSVFHQLYVNEQS